MRTKEFHANISQFRFQKNNTELKENELLQALKFITTLLVAQSVNTAKLVFRGENLQNLCEKLGIETGDSKQLKSRLFMIGDKGRHYQNSHREKIKQKNIFAINDISENIFSYIFDKISDIQKSTTNQHLEKFVADNNTFFAYFKKKENKKNFSSKILSLNEWDILTIRNYFLTVLHQMGKIGFYDRSFLVSTTTKLSIALNFSGSNIEEQIILVGWVPKNKNIYSSRQKAVRLLSTLSIPTAQKAVFTGQHEISLNGGFLPHYLLGYILPKQNVFELNPAIFLHSLNPEVVNDGFEIDQSTFVEFISKTDYGGFFTLDSEGLYCDS